METMSELRAEVRALRNYCVVLTVSVAVLFFVAFSLPGRDVIRTKGIVVTDPDGRDRILIGAPVPASGERIRSNLGKAKNAWGNRYPSFDWYKNLENGTNGMIILDERGFDRIAIGDPTPDPNIGRRISPSVGMVINDGEGFERSGWGFFPDKNRVVLGLDSPDGTEGVVLSVLEDRSTGMSVTGGANQIFLGSSPPQGILTEMTEPFNGLLIRDSAGTKYSFNTLAPK